MSSLSEESKRRIAWRVIWAAFGMGVVLSVVLAFYEPPAHLSQHVPIAALSVTILPLLFAVVTLTRSTWIAVLLMAIGFAFGLLIASLIAGEASVASVRTFSISVSPIVGMLVLAIYWQKSPPRFVKTTTWEFIIHSSSILALAFLHLLVLAIELLVALYVRNNWHAGLGNLLLGAAALFSSQTHIPEKCRSPIGRFFAYLFAAVCSVAVFVFVWRKFGWADLSSKSNLVNTMLWFTFMVFAYALMVLSAGFAKARAETEETATA